MHSYASDVSNYMPFYNYLLGIGNVLFPRSSEAAVIKYVSYAGDVFLAFYAWRIIALQFPEQKERAWFGALAVLSAPTVIANSAIAGQCDAWYTSFLLAAIYNALRGHFKWMLFWSGIAYAFKQQAMFLWPFFFIYLLRGRIPYRWLWIAPAAFLVTIVPAWYEGRPLWDLLRIYYLQTITYDDFANAANFYQYFGGRSHKATPFWVGFGVTAVFISSLLYSIPTAKRWKNDSDPTQVMLLASLSAAMVPFLLPKMLDRYFYPADVCTFILALLRPRWFLIALCFQVASILVYPTITQDDWPRILRSSNEMRMNMAPFFTLAGIVMLLFLCWKNIWRSDHARLLAHFKRERTALK